jgi:formylglycine-generating enzyme required for sulfatase activity
VINVSWEDAQEYVLWLSGRTGEVYRLPSEAEWEYAARAGTSTRFWWGDGLGASSANCYGCGSRWDGERTAPVGSFSANPFGLYDVAGNAREWVEDCWNEGYVDAPLDGSARVSGDCNVRVVRGGSWSYGPSYVRSAYRDWDDAGYAYPSNGFRVARTLESDVVFGECPECPEMVEVAAGSFVMGSPESEEGRSGDEGPTHHVTVARPFAIGKYEVTFAEWDACVEAGGCSNRPDDGGWGRGDRPVINVSWEDAQEYVLWLSGRTGEVYRLPSETEWEYAARGGTSTLYSWGDEVGHDNANCDGCGSLWDDDQTAPVGSFWPNALGLYDIHGNVSEWVEDCWHDSYSGAPSDGSARVSGDCSLRVVRGGSWYYGPSYVRSAGRTTIDPALWFGFNGFRVARTLD